MIVSSSDFPPKVNLQEHRKLPQRKSPPKVNRQPLPFVKTLWNYIRVCWPQGGVGFGVELLFLKQILKKFWCSVIMRVATVIWKVYSSSRVAAGIASHAIMDFLVAIIPSSQRPSGHRWHINWNTTMDKSGCSNDNECAFCCICDPSKGTW